MDTGEALLRAVLADKADDLPRLVYADYLEENGDADLAEFIRIQCELAKPEHKLPAAIAGVSGCICRTCLLKTRERELWGRHHREWFTPDRHFVTISRVQLARVNGPVTLVERGFIAEVRCTFDGWRGIECECRGQAGFTRACESCGCLRAAPGIGPQIVKRHPVERVVITDKVPWEWRDNPRTYGWFDGTGIYGPPINVSHIIPPDVARFLLPAMTKTADQYTAESPEAANKALSDALVKWAESQIT